MVGEHYSGRHRRPMLLADVLESARAQADVRSLDGTEAVRARQARAGAVGAYRRLVARLRDGR